MAWYSIDLKSTNYGSKCINKKLSLMRILRKLQPNSGSMKMLENNLRKCMMLIGKKFFIEIHYILSSKVGF